MTLTRENLIQICPGCNGEGMMYDPPRSETDNSTFNIERNGAWQTSMTCSNCNGTGEILTDEGKAIASVFQLLRAAGQV